MKWCMMLWALVLTASIWIGHVADRSGSEEERGKGAEAQAGIDSSEMAQHAPRSWASDATANSCAEEELEALQVELLRYSASKGRLQ